MREIKFRAWDKVEKTMKYFYYGIFNRIPFGFEDLSELMQYTGLKDKNGVEIYEGDIIKTLINFGPAGDDYINIPVEYVKKYGRWNWQEWVFDSVETLPEVIGNIYQTPELLNG